MKLDTLGRMKKARIWFTLVHPFYGSLLQTLTLKVDNSCPTAYTDGDCIAFSDKINEVLSDDEEFKFVTGHEVMHCVYMHMFRYINMKQSGIDMGLYNQAADYRINWDLTKDGIGKRPSWVLYDEKYDQGWTTMMIYEDLKKKQQAQQRNGGKGKGGDSESGNGTGQQTLDDHDMWEKVEGDLDQKAQEMTSRVVDAYQTAKQAGKVPSGMDRLVGDLVEHKVPWEDLIFATVASHKRANKSWRRLNKRMQHKGINIQGQGKAKMMNFAFAMDTSGSVSDDDLRLALSEVYGSMQQLDAFTLHVMNFDTEIHSYNVYKEGDDFDFKPTGCGGTDLSCISDFIEEREIKIEHLFVMTDGYTCNWNAAGDYETTFIMTTDVVAPHGETIHYDNIG